MNIPEYILTSAREYAASRGGGRDLEDAYVAGYKAARKRNVNDVVPIDEDLFEECWREYGYKGSRSESFIVWCKNLTDKDRKMVLQHIRPYTASREREFQKDFQSYLRKKTFLDAIIAKGGVVVYDPLQSSKNDEYRPLTDGIFQYWDNKRKCLMFNGHLKMLKDGYTSENRPDGAKCAWNMYTRVWSSSLKEWVRQ